MGYSIDINQAFQQVFGFEIPNNPFIAKRDAFNRIVRKDYAIPAKGSQQQNSNENNGYVIPAYEPGDLTAPSGAPLWDTDVYGREYYMPVYLSRADDNGAPKSYLDKNDPNVWAIPIPVISAVDGGLHVNDRRLVERGTAHEIISANDIVFRVRSLLVTEDGSYPAAMVNQFATWSRRKEALTIVSALTDEFLDSQDKVILRSYSLQSSPGNPGLRGLTMDFVSDYVFTLDID